MRPIELAVAAGPARVRSGWRALVAVALLAATPAWSQTVWRMPTEYPASALPGEGLATFAASIASRAGGRLAIQPSYDASLGLKSADMPAAIRAGTVEAGDMFLGTIAGVDPVFALSSLPFVAATPEDARRLAERARPAYAAALARSGQHLLYLTPWPPTGIWSKRPLDGAAALDGLTIRTYDATSTQVLARAGARALNISFADAEARIADGTVEAVLSSGDGGAGRKLWDRLPHFTAIAYAFPLSAATVGTAAYEALDPALREAVDAAAAETEARQWAALSTRLDENYARMRQNGVIIRLRIDADLARVLRAAGTEAVAVWTRRVGPEMAALLETVAPR